MDLEWLAVVWVPIGQDGNRILRAGRDGARTKGSGKTEPVALRSDKTEPVASRSGEMEPAPKGRVRRSLRTWGSVGAVVALLLLR